MAAVVVDDAGNDVCQSQKSRSRDGEVVGKVNRSGAVGRFSNFFQKKYLKRDQPYSQAANPFGQYIGLSDLNLTPHFYLLFSSILLTISHLFIINFTNERGLIIITLMIILISF